MNILYAFAVGLFLVASPARAHSVIRGGGDVVGSFLESMRSGLVTTFAAFNSADISNRAAVCSDQGLSLDQWQLCTNFLLATSNEVIAMNSTTTSTPFMLSSKPLLLFLPDGRTVAAMTNLGPQGPIIFDYARISGLTPTLMLGLMSHEFGHKAAFPHRINTGETRNYIQDEGQIGAFRTGRDLLDAAGNALAKYAARIGVIDTEFRVIDTFYCKETTAGSPQYIAVTGRDVRAFNRNIPAPARFEKFVSGVGANHWLQFNINTSDACYSVDLNIHEAYNCDLKQNGPDRYTKISLTKNVPGQNGQADPEPEIVAEATSGGFNPICENDPVARNREIKLNYLDMEFSCRFLSSEIAKPNSGFSGSPPSAEENSKKCRLPDSEATDSTDREE